MEEALQLRAPGQMREALSATGNLFHVLLHLEVVSN